MKKNLNNYSDDNFHHYNNNRRVQFSANGGYNNNNNDSNSSNRSLPTRNPLQSQESMPYRPELNQFNNSHNSRNNDSNNLYNNYNKYKYNDHDHQNHETIPTFTNNMKSIEIGRYNKPQKQTHSNNSTPEYIINEHDDNHHAHSHNQPMVRPKLPMNTSMNTSNEYIHNKRPLINQESRYIPKQNHMDNHSGIDQFDIFTNTNYNNYNQYPSKTQAYNRQGTMSNASYDHIPSLFDRMSTMQIDDQMSPPPLPNAVSIALNSNSHEILEMKQPQQPQSKRIKLSLQKHFSNDIKAFETWMACCDIQDDTFGYYSALYPLLCEIFAEITKCSRVPRQRDLEEVILKHGAKKMQLSKLHHMTHISGTITSDLISKNTKYNSKPPITPPPSTGNNHSNQSNDDDLMKKHLATVSSGSFHDINNKHHFSSTISFDFDNPGSTPKWIVTIKYKQFRKFWKWFNECCLIIKELAHLWDANEQSAFQIPLFCGREECQQILQQAPSGTFMLRLSSVIKGGIVLSYCEPSFAKKKDKHFKHTILIRRRMNEYELRSQSKKKGKNNLTTISALIRSFVKIKFLYTPNNLYPKKNVF